MNGKRNKSAQTYAAENPLGGPAKVFDAMAAAIRAGDAWEDVLHQFGFAEVKADKPAASKPTLQCNGCAWKGQRGETVMCGSVGPLCPSCHETCETLTLSESPAEPAARHPDDEAVDRFAYAMKQKLALARDKGRSGWQQMNPAELSDMLRDHLEKGDPRDVANFCMFLWHHGWVIETTNKPAAQEPVGIVEYADLQNFFDAEKPLRMAVKETSQGSIQNLPKGTELYTHRTPEAVREPVASVLAEVAKATAKFPTWPTDPLHAVAVLGEEFGELTKAVLQHTYEPHKSTADDVRTEAIQTAAMALRFLMSLECYRYQQGEQHKQGNDHASN